MYLGMKYTPQPVLLIYLPKDGGCHCDADCEVH